MYLLNETVVIAVATILIVLATLAVTLRVLKTDSGDTWLHRWHSDDYLCVVALILTYPMTVMIIWGAFKGSVGGHSLPSDAEQWIDSAGPAWITLAQVFWVTFFLQPLVLGCIRLAILFLYRRFFSSYKAFNIISWGLVAAAVAWTIAFFFGLLFDCGTKVDANWGSLAEIGEQCPFGFLPTIIYTILDACLDLFVLLLPIPWIFQLKLSMAKKFSLLGCFMLGGIATAAAFVRMTIFIETGIPAAALNRTEVMGLPTYDILGIVSGEIFWTMIETTIALIAVSLPAIRKIFLRSAFGQSIGLASFTRLYRTLATKSGMSKATDLESSGNRSSTKSAPHVTVDTFKSLHVVSQFDRIAAEAESSEKY